MIEAVDWCLANEERRSAQQNLTTLAFGCFEPQKLKGQKQSAQEKAIQKEYRRHVSKLRNMSAPAPRASNQKSKKKERKRSFEGDGTGVISSITIPGSNEAYERLFNPQWGTVRSKQGLCAALGYLVLQFLELKKTANGNLADGPRYSLRLAVSSLARHHTFDEPLDVKAPRTSRLLRPSIATAELDEIDEEENRWKTQPGHEQEFRSAAVALLCILDAALAWRPSDPLGWLGQAEDAEGAVLARERGVCSFSSFAGKVRKSLKKASGGCQIAWQRIEVHLDAIRARTLPEPWPWIWVLNEEASMLVRNRTKVPLRVELHRRKVEVSPFADLPLLKQVMRWIHGKERPILVADVKPGIEWALRPRAKEGREFRVRLMTKAGVMVCARGLRRGQSFDFQVPVPPPPAQLRVASSSRQSALTGIEGTMQGRIQATDDAVKAFGGKEPDDRDDRGSIASTATPSLASGRLSFASTASSMRPSSVGKEPMEGMAAMALKLEERRRKVEGLPPLASADENEESPTTEPQQAPQVAAPKAERRGLLAESSVEGFRCCLCPRCLHSMPLRRTRPRASVYSGGVRCDHCKKELMGEEEKSSSPCTGEDAQEAFCHCSRCWFDLCRQCGYKEMREVWWGED